MRFFRAAAVILLSATYACGADEDAFPLWQEGEQAALEAEGWVLGALLVDEPAKDGEVATPLVFEEPKPEDIADDHKLSPEIPEEYLDDYFAERPKVFLTDPQGLLRTADYRDRLGFLNYHAGDSAIDLFVYLIGGDQEIPSAVREEEMIERFFADGRPAAVVYYYLGAPQRSVLLLSPSITDTIVVAEQQRALESSVMQALERTSPTEQLEKFLVQLSIRIYWMERMISSETSPLEGSQIAAIPVSPARAGDSDKWMKLRELAAPWVLPASGAGAVCLTVLSLLEWLRRRARYHFPEFEVEPRLGGAHAAGVGAVISFASAAVPPASQRDQVPDYLRRA